MQSIKLVSGLKIKLPTPTDATARVVSLDAKCVITDGAPAAHISKNKPLLFYMTMRYLSVAQVACRPSVEP